MPSPEARTSPETVFLSVAKGETMNNLVLIGMPGSGKSTVGVILAKTLGLRYLDGDLLIQEREGMLLQDLIDRKGMGPFLAAEEAALCSIDQDDTVVATGGSAVYSPAAMEHLRRAGRTIYLRLSLPSIVQRLHNIHSRGIAMAPGETLADLYEKRTPLYEAYADLTVDCEGLDVEEIVEAITRRLAG